MQAEVANQVEKVSVCPICYAGYSRGSCPGSWQRQSGAWDVLPACALAWTLGILSREMCTEIYGSRCGSKTLGICYHLVLDWWGVCSRDGIGFYGLVWTKLHNPEACAWTSPSRYPGDVFLEFADHGVETALKNTETNLIW